MLNKQINNDSILSNKQQQQVNNKIGSSNKIKI